MIASEGSLGAVVAGRVAAFIIQSRAQKKGLLEKGSFQKSPFSRDSREVGDSREPTDCGKQRRIRPFSGHSRESRDSLSERPLS